MKLRIPAQQKVLSLLICLFCLLLTAKGVSAQDEISDLLGRINNLRATVGLPAYTLNGALAAAAQSQSQWLIDNGCAIAHVHPDGSSPRSRAQAAGYTTSEVSENIYCGGFAQVDDAWIFWINSGVHYAGLVNTRYKEIGIGVAHGANGSGFTLVFGNPGGPDFVPPAPAGGDASVSAAAGASEPPSYVVGVDEHGNIKHEIQPGDTIGDILLIYGYTWADIPTLLALNNMTQDDFRTLEVGTVLLIPPQAGTYTPTPGDTAPTATPEAPTTEPPAQIALEVLPSATPAPTNTLLAAEPTAAEVVQSANTEGLQPAALIEPSSTPANAVEPSISNASVLVSSTTVLSVALSATDAPVSLPRTAGTVTPSSRTSPALIVALVVQVGVLLGAGFEFIRRMRRRKK